MRRAAPPNDIVGVELDAARSHVVVIVDGCDRICRVIIVVSIVIIGVVDAV